MKSMQRILIITLVAFMSAGVNAQVSESGIKGGLNLSNMSTDGSSDDNLRAGFHVGVFNKVEFTDQFAVQPELLYSTKGLVMNYDDEAFADGESKFNINYLDLPVKLVFNLSEDFSFEVGPYVSYLLSSNIETDAEVLDYFEINDNDQIDRDNFNLWSYGLTGGLGFELNQMVFGFNYQMGLAPVAKDDTDAETMLGDAKNNVIQLYAGIKF